MEGICAIISYDKQIGDISFSIQKMAETLSDGESLIINKKCGANWAIAGSNWSEPHWNSSLISYQDENVSIMGIAEIFNIDELAAEYGLAIDNAGAIIAKSYFTDRIEWAKKIRGTFSIIIIENKTHRFCAASDRIGVRPLCWLKQGNTYYIGSRINAIRQVCAPLEVDNNSIFAYMYYEMIPSPYTIYKGLQKLEPGFLLYADAHENRLKRYWNISNTPKISAKEDEIASNVYQTINNAVNLKNGQVSQNKTACFLSGGTDSSSICGLLSKTRQDPVTAYSIGFSETGYNEMYYARKAAEAFGLDHHEYYITPDDLLQSLPNIVKVYDEPFGNSSIIPAYYCAKLAANNGFQYMLAGDGGDEVFGGNERYSTQQVFRNYFKIPSVFRHGLIEPLLINRLEKLPFGIFQKGGRYIRRSNLEEVQRIHSYRYVDFEDMFTHEFLESCDLASTENIAYKHFHELEKANALDRHLYLDMKLTITDNDLRKVSRMCDLAHVRVRYPLLDSKVVDFGFQIEENLKLRGTAGLRYIFKKAFQDLLPQEILNKQKHGFGLPIANWLRSNSKIQQFAHDLLFDKKHLNRGYFKPDFVKKIWQLQLEDPTPYFGTLVWLMMLLELWYRVHLDGDL